MRNSVVHTIPNGSRGKGVAPGDASVAVNPPVASVLRPELRGARVLLVEDSDIVREVSRSVLEDAGIVVEEAVDGEVAVAMMRENRARCDLILMDVQMPQLDGVAATRLIRADFGDGGAAHFGADCECVRSGKAALP